MYSHLSQQCTAAYSWWNPTRQLCLDTAATYYAVVVAKTFFDSL